MYSKLLTCLALSILLGCAGKKPNAEKQTLDFGSFSIVTPKGWTKINAKGTDSYVGRIAIDNTDTIHFDLGWYSNKLSEQEPQIIERSMLKNIDGFDKKVKIDSLFFTNITDGFIAKAQFNS